MNWYKKAQTTEDLPEKLPETMCFSNAKKWAWDHDNGDTYIMHGKVKNKTGNMIDHAWVEQENMVIDPTLGIKIDKNTYYWKTEA